MKTFLSLTKKSLYLSFALSLSALIHQAGAATLYWDVNGATGGLGGTGTWSNGTGNWSTDTAGTISTTWNNANLDVADFRAGGGTVSTSGAISASQILFTSTTGNYTIQSGTLTIDPNPATNPIIQYASGTGSHLISSNIVIQDDASVASASSYIIRNSVASTLTVDGTININYTTGTAGGVKTFALQGNNAASVIEVNGAFGAGPGASTTQIQFGGVTGATYRINGNNSALDGTQTAQVLKGTVHLGHNNALGNGTVQLSTSGTAASETAAILTNGARTIANNISLGGGNAAAQLVVGGGTADDSTYSGTIAGGSGVQILRLTAAAGGRTNFSGEIRGTGTGTVVIQGQGIVAFTRAAGAVNPNYTRATQVSSGTLLLMNTSGSATGTGALSVAAGARLGGTGFSTSAITADSATSMFAPGNMLKEGTTSVGTLTLSGGLTAANGATFKFDISGGTIDQINFAAANLDLDGTATFDFTNLSTVNIGTPYTLFTGTTGDWSLSTASFVFNAPSGYMLDSSYGGGNGYVFNTAGRSLTVQFATVPEPSAAALLIVAIGAVCFRRKR